MYDYNCPDCNVTKLQSEKNARKINEVISRVNQIIDNQSATNEVIDNIQSSLDNIEQQIKQIITQLNETTPQEKAEFLNN